MKGYGQDPLRLGPHVFASTVTSHTANAAAYNRQDSGRMAIRTLTCLTPHLQCSPDGGDHASPNLRSLEHLFRLPFQAALSDRLEHTGCGTSRQERWEHAEHRRISRPA